MADNKGSDAINGEISEFNEIGIYITIMSKSS
jgi:hypothetical protein